MSRVRNSCIAAMKAAMVPPLLLVYAYLRFGVLACIILGVLTYARTQELATLYGNNPKDLILPGLLSACIATALFGFLWRIFGLPTGVWEWCADRLSDD